MIHIVNDEKVHCPICWAETRLGEFQRLYSGLKLGDNLIHIFSLLTGKDYDEVYQAQSEDLNAGLYQAVSFVINEPKSFKSMKVPSEFVFNGKSYKSPGVKSLTVGQAFALRSIVTEAKNLECSISITLAIYFQPLIDGTKFSLDRAKEIELDIQKMLLTETYPLGFFLLSKLNNSGASGLLSRLHLILQRMRNERPLLKQLTLTGLVACMMPLCLIVIASDTVSYRELSKRNLLTSSSHSLLYGKNKPSIKNDSTNNLNQ